MRNYKREYENYHSRPEQKIRRAARNAARRLFTDADPDKDVHHKDNNPLNNDKKNLSLVTQYYNRREPRLRVREEESALVIPTGRDVDKFILSKFQEVLRKAGFAKKQKMAKEFGITLTQRGKKYQVEDAISRAKERAALKKKHADEKEAEKIAVKRASEDIEEGTDGAAMIDLMQKYLLSKNPKEKKNLLKQINKYQKKLGLGVTEDIDEISVDKATGRKKAGTYGRTTGGYGAKAAKISKRAGSKGARRVAKRKLRGEEDMGSVTGPHIAGTGDDSDTVVVKKKKKVYKREALKDFVKKWSTER